jgi:hypothetical protein
MRFMMLLKADQRTEAGVLPTREDMEAMGRFNQQLIDAGALVDANGLQPSSKGAKITYPGGKPVVTDGPFAETKELIAGYWTIQVASKEEAIAWAKKVPVAHLPNVGRTPEIELRQVFELADFADVPEAVAEQERSFSASRRNSR